MVCFPAKSDIRRSRMDNNQYLLGIMTDRCRILEDSLRKTTELNKIMANELKPLRARAKEMELILADQKTNAKVVVLSAKKAVPPKKKPKKRGKK
jgi:hypothetical protein